MTLDKYRSMNRVGGFAAILMAMIYVTGIFIFAVILNPEEMLNSLDQILFIRENKNLYFFIMLLLYVIGGMGLLVLVQSLHNLLGKTGLALNATAAIIGYIWSAIILISGLIYLTAMQHLFVLIDQQPDQVATAWLVISIVFEGLGGGTEIVGGVWMLLISAIAIMNNIFPRWINALGIVVGLIGFATMIPSLNILTMVFGLTQILWFIGVGICLLKQDATTHQVVIQKAAPKA